MKNIKGFTLLEVLTIVAIVGILTAIALPSLAPKNPWRQVLIDLTNTTKLVRAKAMSTGRYYRLYPTNTSDSASVYGMDTVASGQASFVVEQGINGASCALFSNSSNSGLPSSTVAGSWVPDSRYNLSFPKSFNYYYYLNLATANGKVLGQPVCFAPNGYVSNFKTVYGSGGSNHLWLTNSDKSIRGSSALIYFGGFSGKPTIILIDRDYTIIPNDADGFPKI